jgi:solute carrier family 7 (L-type amino acid transporter), member 9/15
VNQELAKEGIPLPFGNRIWATNWPTQNAPFPGLIIHLITTVSDLGLVSKSDLTFVKVIVIVAPPLKVAYPFILDVASYPIQIIDLFVILVRAP